MFLVAPKGASEFVQPQLSRQIYSLQPQMGKNLPAMQENRVQYLGLEDPLEKEMATHSGILAWRITWTEDTVYRVAKS